MTMKNHRTIGFTSLCIAFFLVMLDTTLVPFLYPILISNLEISIGEAAAVNNFYLIAYAGSLLLGGVLGDIWYRKYIFLLGVFLLGIGSFIAVFNGAYMPLLAGRFTMGIGAGLITPQSMAFISKLFDEDERAGAFGIWAAVAGLGTALGPVVAKVSANVGSWEPAFWINVILAGITFILAGKYLDNPQSKKYFNIRKIITVSLLGMATMAMISSLQLSDLHSDSKPAFESYILIIIAIILCIITWFFVKYIGYPPIIQTKKIDFKPYISAVLSSACLGGALTAYYLPLSISFEFQLKFDELSTISLLVLCSLMNSIFGLLAGKLSNKYGCKRLIIIGLLIFASACFLFSIFLSIPEINRYLAIGCAALLISLVGIGAGLAFGPLANSAMSAASIETIGEAAAFYNWMRQVFSAAGGVIAALIFSKLFYGSNLSEAQTINYSSIVGFIFSGTLLMAGVIFCKGIRNEKS
ncbi:MFS transporter [Microbacterium foliorum]|uniref:MFS transporter n=1 Tax=Rothia terrae TaxID=396015 RepID=UPI003428F0DE